jgi:hypothetical protein
MPERAEIVMRIGVRGRERQRTLEAGLGGVELAEVFQRDAEIVQCLDVVGFDFEDLPQQRRGLGGAIARDQQGGEIEGNARLARRQRQSGAEAGLGAGVIAE